MDATLLLIAFTGGATVVFLTLYAHCSRTWQHRTVAARISAGPVGLDFAPSSILRSPQGARVPFAGMLPLSEEARERMGLELLRAGWSIHVGEYLAIRVASALAAGALAVVALGQLGISSLPLRLVVVLGLTMVGWFAPRLYLTRAQRKRMDAIGAHLPDALTAIAKSLRVGTGLMQGLAHAANETPAPLGPELQAVLRDLELGADAEDAFGALSRRAGSPDLAIAVTAIVIQRRSGGNLSEILTNVTETIRERVKLKRDIAVLTTQQRLGSYVAACLPLLVALAFTLLQPEMGRLLVTTTAGLIALSIGLACEAAGILLIRALAQIDP